MTGVYSASLLLLLLPTEELNLDRNVIDTMQRVQTIVMSSNHFQLRNFEGGDGDGVSISLPSVIVDIVVRNYYLMQTAPHHGIII